MVWPRHLVEQAASGAHPSHRGGVGRERRRVRAERVEHCPAHLHQADDRVLGVLVLGPVLEDGVFERLAVVAVGGDEGLGDRVAVHAGGPVRSPVVEEDAAQGVPGSLDVDLAL